MATEFEIGNCKVEVVLKDIKNIHLSVLPPGGRVRMSAPRGMNLETLRVYAITRLDWIRRQQSRFINQDRETPRSYVSRESHYFLGKRYLLKVTESDSSPTVVLRPNEIELIVRLGYTADQRRIMLENWYRRRLKEEVEKQLVKWTEKIGVSPPDFGVKKMKTKWGSCNQEAKRIWLNLELAKKPRECIEYVVVHELVHLLERKHGQRFIEHMDRFLPQWKQYRAALNRLPISHAEWKY